MHKSFLVIKLLLLSRISWASLRLFSLVNSLATTCYTSLVIWANCCLSMKWKSWNIIFKFLSTTLSFCSNTIFLNFFNIFYAAISLIIAYELSHFSCLYILTNDLFQFVAYSSSSRVSLWVSFLSILISFLFIFLAWLWIFLSPGVLQWKLWKLESWRFS